MINQDLHNKDAAIEFYEARYESGYMEEWDESKKRQIFEILKSLQLPSTGKALDFGCGNGVFTRLIKQVLPKWEVFGVEISQTAVNNAQKRIPQCHFFHTNEAGGYQKKFDFIFSHHVIEHVQNLAETFNEMNNYLKPVSAQLHILPCGNVNSFEYNIAVLHKNGIEKDKDNRFYFEEPGHLRRLTSAEFESNEKRIGFILFDEWYANQKEGAVNWITKSSPRFVKKLTNPDNAVNEEARKKLRQLRSILLRKTYRQFSYTKYHELISKWNKSVKDRLLIILLYFPALLSKSYYNSVQKEADREWIERKKEKNGSEMFLYFKRNA